MADWYIDLDSGNDSTGDGSSGTPYQTFNKACTEASTGDTIILKDGTYTLSSSTAESLTGAAGKALSYRSESGDADSCIIDAVSSYSYEFNFYGTVTSFSGITLKDYAVSRSRCLSFYYADASVEHVIENCVFEGMSGAGTYGTIEVSGIALTLTFRNNVWNKTLAQTQDPLISSVGGTGGVTFNVLNNTFYFTGSSLAPDNGMIYFNNGTANTVNFKNNIVVNDTSQNVDCVWSIQSGVHNAVLANNLYYESGSGGIDDSQGTWNSISSTGGLTGDPLFVDAASGDFTLQSSSPAIDAGTNL